MKKKDYFPYLIVKLVWEIVVFSGLAIREGYRVFVRGEK